VAIMALAGPIQKALARRGRRAAQATAITAAATLGTAPLIAARFGTLSLASLPANVLAAPPSRRSCGSECSRARSPRSPRRSRRR
jgi:competence protein ComEC